MKIDSRIEDIDLGVRNIYRDIGEAKTLGFPVKPNCLRRSFTQGHDMIRWSAHSNPGGTCAETSNLIPFGQLAFEFNFNLDLRFRAGLKANRNGGWLKTLNLYPWRQVHSHVILRQPNDAFAWL